MTVRRLGFYLLAALAVSGWALVWFASRQADTISAGDVARQLTAAGWVQARGKAVIPGAPAGTVPVAVIRGRVAFSPPAAPTPTGPGSGLTPTGGPSPAVPGSPDPGPCVIVPGDLSGGCRAEVVALDGKPWARLYWDGAARLPGGLIVTRGPVLADTVEFTWTAPPPPRRTLIGLDVGLTASPEGLGYEIGGRVCPKGWALNGRLAEGRVCGYARLAETSGRPEGAAGVSLLFGVGR